MPAAVQSNERSFAEMGCAQFLSEYWQRRPLLVREAFPGFRSPLDPDDLAGLACESTVESRIVSESRKAPHWRVRHGPFRPEDFAALPRSRWTLLVHDVEKHLPELCHIIDRFRFVPDWRIDDLMVSYATDGGSVGPHYDDYDVFLLQATGTRRWRFGGPGASEENCVAEEELRIMSQFQPECDVLLEPGDMLYLPPRVPHHGVSEGDCMTFSIGFRAPTWQQWLGAVFERLLERVDADARYSDPGLSPVEHPAEIDQQTIATFRAHLESMLTVSEEDLAQCLGTWLTEPKEHLDAQPSEQHWHAADLDSLLSRGAGLQRNPAVRFLFSERSGNGMTLYVNGYAFRVPGGCEPLVRALCLGAIMSSRELETSKAPAGILSFLAELLNCSYLMVCDGPV